MSYFGLLKLICQTNLIEIDTRYSVRNEHVFVKEWPQSGSQVTHVTGAQSSARVATVNEQLMFLPCWGKTRQEPQLLLLAVVFPVKAQSSHVFLAGVGISHPSTLFEMPSLPPQLPRSVHSCDDSH